LYEAISMKDVVARRQHVSTSVVNINAVVANDTVQPV
jgi:hypothetical protein